MDVLVLGAGVSGHTAAAFLSKTMANPNLPRGYKNEFYAPIPTKATKRLRTNFFVQTCRFFRLNLKIMRIVVRGHS